MLVVSGTLRRSIRGEVSGIRILHKPFEVSHLLDLVAEMIAPAPSPEEIPAG